MQMNMPATSTRLKKDGTPDKRYSSTKASSAPAQVPAAPGATNPQAKATVNPPAPAAQTAPVTNSPAATTRHLKKDGTPDMRYKENRTQGVDKNGTADKRYKQNKQ